ncbi:MAG TPA: regulatory protein RecX [Vicinamibacterales bacterium]
MPERTAYVDGLHMLGRRELSVEDLRHRLLERDHPPADVDRAIALLLENRALDDARVAAAYVRTAMKVKGRGRLRIRRELQEMGIDQGVAAEALAEAFGDVDERAMVSEALRKKLRGARITTQVEYARAFQFLMRQGFPPSIITSVLRASRKSAPDEGD